MILETKVDVPENYFGFAFNNVSIWKNDTPCESGIVFTVRLMIDDVFLGREINILPHMEDIELTRGDVHIISELQKIFNA